MTGQYHFQIDLPMQVLAPEYDLPTVPEARASYSHLRQPQNMLSKEFVDWLESKYLHPRKWMSPLLFYAHPGSRTAVHVDVGCRNIWAMNFIIGEGEVDVNWHSVEGQGEHLDADLNYKRYADDSPILETTVVTNDKVTVSRIGVPHSSRNNGHGAWLMSLRVAPEDLAWMYLKGRMTT